jgi:hypothetical protein
MYKNKFINYLWENFTNLCENEIRNIYELDKEETLVFEGQVDGMLIFSQYGKVCREIYVRDFDIRDSKRKSYNDYSNQEKIVKWFNFMTKMFGKIYIEAFKKFRQDELQKQIDKFNQYTDEVIAKAKDCYTCLQTK